MLPTRAAACTSLLLLAAAFLAFPHHGSAQVPQRTPKRAAGTAAYPPAPSRLRLGRQLRMRSLVAVSAATVTESEPNNLTSQANFMSLGDTAAGTIDPSGDVDFYAVDLTAGTTIEVDVFATLLGSSLDPTVTLYGSDSTTTLAFDDDFYDIDSHIEYTVGTAGRYFVAVASFDGSGGATFTYSLLLSVPGPGDSTTLYATGLGAPYGIAAGATGDLYLTDVDSLRLLNVASTGQVSVVASFSGEYPIGVAVDGFGDVLVSTVDTFFASGKIVRFSGGQRSTFATLTSGGGAAITIGPDGDVWVIDPLAALLRRYDPYGGPKGTIDLSSLNNLVFEMGLAFSPAGDLYLSDGQTAIYKIVSGAPQLAYQGFPFLEGLAFDKDGYLYVANGFLGRVVLLDPSLQVVNDPFARRHLGGPTQLAFLRDGAGAMTARLLADNVGYNLDPPFLGGIVEMNPIAMRAVGFRVGIDLLRIANAVVKNGVVGTDYADTLRLVTAPGLATWSLVSGALPPGLALSVEGLITGIPEQAGAYTFSVRVDAASQFGGRSFTVTVTSPTVAIDAASQHLLGGAQLDITLQRFLDLQGNKNGHFDVGDFRAFLRANGQLPATAVAKTEAP
jgi:hypothetical protein